MENSSIPCVGIITFTDPRETGFQETREAYLKSRHEALVSELRSHGINVVDPMPKAHVGNNDATFGIRSSLEVEACVKELLQGGAEAVILGLWHWTEPFLPLLAARLSNLPVLLYTEDDPTWAGVTAQSAVGACLWEVAPSDHAVTHVRMRSDIAGVLQWARGVTAAQKLRKSNLVLWGGSYCLRMDHLRDDYSLLKARFIRDVLEEDQYVLIKGAERILAHEMVRVEAFLSWLTSSGAAVRYDPSMLTPEALRSEIALYLAARDRLRTLEGESGVDGVSIKCQPEISVMYGVTPCLLPSFLPFGEDAEGVQRVYPTVCEGDVKGLITATLLHKIVPDIPPLFGDLKYVCDNYALISNCGGSSVYYAFNSCKASDVLSKVTLQAQCQGASGGAVGYCSQPGQMTVARLVRVKGSYHMQLGVGRSLEISDEILGKLSWGQTWPHVALSLGVPSRALLNIAGSNHYCAVPGDNRTEIAFACRELGIPVVRIDCEKSIKEALEYIIE